MSAVPADAAIPACSISEAVYRVNHWWRVTRGGVGLGFARRSVLGKVAEEGAQGAAHDYTTAPAPWMAPADEEVDRIVARMPRELRDAVMLDQNRNLPMKVIAAKMNATPREVGRWVANGYGWIACALTVANNSR